MISMKRIWAPWRMKYIEENESAGCIFCEKPKVKKDKKSYILYRGKLCFVMMNIFPYTHCHIMVAPYRHLHSYSKLNREELLEVGSVVQESIRVLDETLHAEGLNIGVNEGRVAGAGIDQHMHIHIVPRWKGDTNFMPLLAEVRVFPEHLDETFDKIYPVFQKIRLSL
jgi:ATP adenylyltransferase